MIQPKFLKVSLFNHTNIGTFQINRNRVQAQRASSNRLQSPQFFSHTLSTPIGKPITTTDTLDYSASRRIRIPSELRRDRALADRDEIEMLLERDADDDAELAGNSVTTSRGLSDRPRTSRLGAVSRPRAPAQASNFGNYQTVIGHGASYSTNTRFGQPNAAAHGYANTPAVAPAYPSYAYTARPAYVTTTAPRYSRNQARNLDWRNDTKSISCVVSKSESWYSLFRRQILKHVPVVKPENRSKILKNNLMRSISNVVSSCIHADLTITSQKTWVHLHPQVQLQAFSRALHAPAFSRPLRAARAIARASLRPLRPHHDPARQAHRRLQHRSESRNRRRILQLHDLRLKKPSSKYVLLKLFLLTFLCSSQTVSLVQNEFAENKNGYS